MGCCPDYIGLHTVDEAANARSSVEYLEWQTSEKHSQKIIASPCDAHIGNTSPSIASGTSAHVTNLNPELGRALTILHNWLTKVVNYKAAKTILTNVQGKHGREQVGAIKYCCQTC